MSLPQEPYELSIEKSHILNGKWNNDYTESGKIPQPEPWDSPKEDIGFLTDSSQFHRHSSLVMQTAQNWRLARTPTDHQLTKFSKKTKYMTSCNPNEKNRNFIF